MLFNERRVFHVVQYPDFEAMADQLDPDHYSWVKCAGFQIGDMLWLNDSTSEDAAQEFTVLRLDPGSFPSPIQKISINDDDPWNWMEINAQVVFGVQVESITVSWCTRAKLIEYMQQCAVEPTSIDEKRLRLVVDYNRDHRCPECM